VYGGYSNYIINSHIWTARCDWNFYKVYLNRVIYYIITLHKCQHNHSNL